MRVKEGVKGNKWGVKEIGKSQTKHFSRSVRKPEFWEKERRAKWRTRFWLL